ncbi:uncharacterized protein LOC133507884 isoform X3 [Syngnathoides biaculeatus]|uniref:uncharacterized protein LOC133507884 isoform X3 n=1 Tax=Syngnathoides biaculeatus TaxID=300417 RepID=UPI002ADE27A5|nr:uncharacterized protein LOC133507884 isoform X3 [Syngnathoides biaculeatus]
MQKADRTKNQFKKWVKSANSTTYASFVAAQEIGRHGKPFIDGEYMKESFLKISEHLFADFKNKDEIVQKIREMPLSAKTVKDHTIVVYTKCKAAHPLVTSVGASTSATARTQPSSIHVSPATAEPQPTSAGALSTNKPQQHPIYGPATVSLRRLPPMLRRRLSQRFPSCRSLKLPILWTGFSGNWTLLSQDGLSCFDPVRR